MQIQTYSPRWQAEVCALAERVLGKGFFELTAEDASDPDTAILVCISEDEELAGFARGLLLPQGILNDFLDNRVPDIPQILRDADEKGVLGVIQTVIVAPEHWGKGIGTNLLRIIHDDIIGRGADKLIVTFKRSPKSPQVNRMMEKLGYSFWIGLETAWKARCDAGDVICSDRGETCTCEAMIYSKEVF